MEPTNERKVLQLLSFSESEKKSLQTFENCCKIFSNLIPVFNEDPKSINSLFEALKTIRAKEGEHEKVIKKLFEEQRTEHQISEQEKIDLKLEISRNKKEQEENRKQIEQERAKVSSELTKLRNENTYVMNELNKIKDEKTILETIFKDAKLKNENFIARNSELEREIQNIKVNNAKVIEKKDENLKKFLQIKNESIESVKKITEERDEILKKNKSQSLQIFHLTEEKEKLERLFNETKHYSSNPENLTCEENLTQNDSFFDIVKGKMENIKTKNENLNENNLSLQSQLEEERKKNENLSAKKREEIKELNCEKQRLIELKEQNEAKIKELDESFKKLRGRYDKYKLRNQTLDEEKNKVIIENQQLKSEKVSDQTHLLTLEQELKTIKGNYLALQKINSEVEERKNMLLSENERLKDEKDELNLKLKNLEQENIHESKTDNLKDQISDLKKMEEKYISVQCNNKLIEEEKIILMTEIEILKNEKDKLNVSLLEEKNKMNRLLNENEQLKSEKFSDQTQLKTLEQDLNKIQENYIDLLKANHAVEDKKSMLLTENEILKNEQEELNLKLKNLVQENINESQVKILKEQISNLQKMEENYISVQNKIKLVEEEKSKLLTEIEKLKNEKKELNSKISELCSQKFESNEKFLTKRSLDMENIEKNINFISVQKINDLEFSLDILDESISDVIFETDNDPMEFNLKYNRNLSAVFSDPKSYLKSKHMIKEQSFIQFSLDQQKIFKFDKLNERHIKKYNERQYQIKYIYSGSYISKKPIDKQPIKQILETIEEEKTTNLDPVQNKITHISHNSFDLEIPFANQEIQKKDPSTPKFNDKSLLSGSGLSSRTQKTEDFANNQQEEIKENKDENPNSDQESKDETCKNDCMTTSMISELNGSSYRITNPNLKDSNFESENSSDCGSNFRTKEKFFENSTLYPIPEDSELKEKKVKDSISFSSETEMEKTEKSLKEKKISSEISEVCDFVTPQGPSEPKISSEISEVGDFVTPQGPSEPMRKKMPSEISEEYDFVTPQSPPESMSGRLSLKNAPLENSSDIFYESNIKANIPYGAKSENLKDSEILSEEEEN